MSAITDKQKRSFWTAFGAACGNMGLMDRGAREGYRREVLRAEGGVMHLNDLDRTAGFDAVMARLWMDAGCYDKAVKYVESTAFRLIAVIEQKAQAVAGANWREYLYGIKQRSGIGGDRANLTDFTESELRAMIAILDTHSRRHRHP